MRVLVACELSARVRDAYQKRTNLWLKGVPPLTAEVTEKPNGLLRAMADQWG